MPDGWTGIGVWCSQDKTTRAHGGSADESGGAGRCGTQGRIERDRERERERRGREKREREREREKREERERERETTDDHETRRPWSA